MNENIKKLIKRATAQYSPTYYSEKWTEKFAELIVRECIDYCGEKLSKHYIENHTEKEQGLLLASIADYSNEIKKHFGVKP